MLAKAKAIFKKVVNSFKIISLIEELQNRYIVYLVIKEKSKMRKYVKRDFDSVKQTDFDL